MNQTDTGDELSMEDILASIRQIIAEEPKVGAPPLLPQAAPHFQPAQSQAVQSQAVQSQPVQSLPAKAAGQVTTVGLPQGYAVPRPEPSGGVNSAAQGVPMPTFPDQRLRSPTPAPLSPRIAEVAAQPQAPVRPQPTAPTAGSSPRLDGASTGTLASRLNDVFGAGPTLRQPDSGRPAVHSGAQSVKSAVDADLADLMDDDAPRALFSSAAPLPVPIPIVAAQPAPGGMPQPVVAPRVLLPSAAPVAAPVERSSLFGQPVAEAALVVVQTEGGAPPLSSVMTAPHPLPSWLNRASDPAPDVAAPLPVEPSAAGVAAMPPAPASRVEPSVEAVARPKAKSAPVVIAAMVSAPKMAPVVPPAAVLPAAVATLVVPPDVATSAVAGSSPASAPTLSMADILPARDQPMAWAPVARVDPEPAPTNAAAPLPEPVAVEPTAEPASSSAPQIEAQADAAVASALGSLAAGLAASRLAVAPKVDVAETLLPPEGAVASMPAADRLAAPVEAATLPVATAQALTTQDARGEGLALEPVYPHDDTAVELLRPMLRHWLDSNMPRIVEKALRAELAVNPPGSKSETEG